MSLMNWLEFVRSAPDPLNIRAYPDPDTVTVTGSVADTDPELRKDPKLLAGSGSEPEPK